MKQVIWTIGCTLVGMMNGFAFLFVDNWQEKVYALIWAVIELGILWLICHFIF